jgi:hypothetical protein
MATKNPAFFERLAGSPSISKVFVTRDDVLSKKKIQNFYKETAWSA